MFARCRRESDGKQVVTLTHEELAKLVSTRRERISLLLSEFRRMGLVQYTTGRILVDEVRTKRYLQKQTANP